MTPVWFPEGSLFEDYAKGKLVWKQHIFYVEYGQEEKEKTKREYPQAKY